MLILYRLPCDLFLMSCPPAPRHEEVEGGRTREEGQVIVSPPSILCALPGYGQFARGPTWVGLGCAAPLYFPQSSSRQ